MINIGPGDAPYEEPPVEPVPYLPVGRRCETVAPNADPRESYIISLEWFRRFERDGAPRKMRETGFKIGQRVKLKPPECGGIVVQLVGVDLYIDIGPAGGDEHAMIIGPALAYEEDGRKFLIPADWAQVVGQSPLESGEFRDFLSTLGGSK